ncbi:MAG: phosphatase PAP2 family protein [Maritimibacter sp.]
MVVLAWIAQPARANSFWTMGDVVPSFHGGSYMDGLEPEFFTPINENHWQMAGRVLRTSTGGFNDIVGEIAEIGTFPFREPVLFAGAAIGVGLLMSQDERLTTWYQDDLEPAFKGFDLPSIYQPLNSTFSIEDQYLLLGIAGTYGYGVLAKDERAQIAATLSIKAMAYSVLTTQLFLKPAFGRVRPVPNLSTFAGSEADANGNGFTTNPYLFGQTTGIHIGQVRWGTSFPSYHFTEFFAVARVYSGVYDNSWVPYVAAGLLTFSNMRAHNHWFSDMAAGALVGTVIGQVVLNGYADRRDRGFDTMFMPSVSSKGVSAQFTMTF